MLEIRPVVHVLGVIDRVVQVDVLQLGHVLAHDGPLADLLLLTLSSAPQ